MTAFSRVSCSFITGAMGIRRWRRERVHNPRRVFLAVGARARMRACPLSVSGPGHYVSCARFSGRGTAES